MSINVFHTRKLDQNSKIKGMEVDQSCHNSTVMINEEPPNLEQAYETENGVVIVIFGSTSKWSSF